MDKRTLGARAGLVAPPLFAVVVLAQDWLRADFDPVRRFISELAIGAHGWIQSANFLVYGTLWVVFAQSVRAEFRDHRGPRAGAALFTLIGTSVFMSGLFVADSAGEVTWHGVAHLLFGLLVFSLMPVSALIFFLHFRRDFRWRRMRAWSLVTFVVSASFWLAMVPGGFSPAVLEALNPWAGLLNRAVVGVWLLWQFAFARRLLGDAS